MCGNARMTGEEGVRRVQVRIETNNCTGSMIAK